MAEDAAGAVRRTPRPNEPTTRDQTQRELARLYRHHYDFVEQSAAERNALQRQVDGFKRVRDDVDELLIAALGPHAEPGGGGWYADVSQLIAERDLARWLHAELQHKFTLPCGECHPCSNWSDETWRRAGRKAPAVVTWEDKLAETRGLYGRLDDAIKLIEEMAGHLRQDAALTLGVETRLAALQGDQPTEPGQPCRDLRCTRVDGRCVGMHCARCGEPCGAQGHTCSTEVAEPETPCMNGPAKQHTLRMVEIIKALRAAAVNGQLPATVEPLPFAKLARAIVDHWPTGEADRG